jgi:hypothetical protein
MIAAVLRPACRPSGRQIVKSLRRLLAALRAHWPRVEIMLRGDSHFCTPEVPRLCRANRLDYIPMWARRRGDTIRSALDAGDDTLDTIPAGGTVVEFLETAELFAIGDGPARQRALFPAPRYACATSQRRRS